jgi:hypothetical protein
MKHILKITAILILGLFVSVQTAYASTTLSALDTVVNFGTKIEARNLQSGTSVDFKIKKPDGGFFDIQVVADSSGKATTFLPEGETKVAGIYTVNLNNGAPFDSTYGGQTTFRVFPGEMNKDSSSVYSDKETFAANGMDFTKIGVRIVDEFGNVLELHNVKLVSSRNADQILEDTLTTDSNGVASFLVSSMEPGFSTFTVTDETAGETVSNRVRVNFYDAPVTLQSVGGDPVLLAQAGQIVSGFKIENIPASVRVNETTGFTVTAVDASGQPVPSYTGTVVFSSTDINAQLPTQYTYMPVDQGRKTFDLGLTFRTVGSQTLTVQQQNDATKRGFRTVQVLAASSNGTGATGSVRITKPATGTYAVNTLEVAGEANSVSRVAILDRGQRIGEVQSDSSGRFSFNTPLLTDGQHIFYATSNGVQSEAVTVTIDSTPARVEHSQIQNKNLAPGGTTEVSVNSDSDLNSVQVTVGDDFIIDLVPDAVVAGLYTGTITAPAAEGEYTVNATLTDKYGNVTPLTEIGKLKVDAGLRPPPVPSFNVPSKVRGVAAVPWNAAVTLTWQPATAEAGMAMYRIYYGTDQQNLNLVTNTATATNSFTVTNLRNGSTYYFQVVGVDNNGNEGDNKSDAVSASPNASAPLPPSGTESGQDGSPVLCDPGPCPPDVSPPPVTPQDGPEVWGMILAALMATSGWKVLRKSK